MNTPFSLPWETYASGIQSLAEHEVFVFGSNATGFHGAGSAGQAMRGDARNTWRTDAAFLAAKDAPAHSPLRVGHWAVFGQARGPMQGHSGKSYAVQTIVRPGQRRSLPLGEIRSQLVTLLDFVRRRPHLTFLVTPLGEGSAGYTRAEMEATWEAALGGQPLPTNMRFIQIGHT